jgi:hypothetical protein
MQSVRALPQEGGDRLRPIARQRQVHVVRAHAPTAEAAGTESTARSARVPRMVLIVTSQDRPRRAAAR